MPKVSVVVPVYNVEEYIDKCLDSLAKQSFDDYEVIVVNDGSPDNSQRIIDDYVKKYPAVFKSFIKKNGGLSDARNFGIKKSLGEYIAFVDSDDYTEENMIYELYNKAKKGNFDIVACDVNYIYKNKKQRVSSLVCNDIYEINDIKKQMINIYPAAWNKIYKKELFKNDVYFKKGVWYEDVEFLYRIFPYVKSIGFVDKGLINYVQRDNSIIKTFDERLYDYINNWNGIVDFYKDRGFYNEYYNELEYCYVRYLFMTFIKGAANFSLTEYKKACKRAEENVEKNFPNYKENVYLTGMKGFYLKHFDDVLQRVVYLLYKHK